MQNAQHWREHWMWQGGDGSSRKKVTTFADAQAAITRIASDEPGPGQQYALKAGRWKRSATESSKARHNHRSAVVSGSRYGI